MTQDTLLDTLYDGRYRIRRRIGAGGMANVYLAEDETLGRPVAIKVLHERYATDDAFIERFQREASAAARLNHPNIVQVYDRGASGDTYYIAMEYVDGRTIKDLVRERGPLTQAELLGFSKQALSALRFAHRNGIVHRDIKPHNLMVDAEGRVKVADFGIARAGADAGLTEAGSIVGTAQYLSPEQARGGNVAAPSDLYSLGVVMFEMATGQVPFDGDLPVNVALKHVNDAVPRPSSINPNVSPALEAVILRALQKDPSLRYGSADEMLADLERVESGTVADETAVLTQALPRESTTRVLPVSGMQPPPRPIDATSAYAQAYEPAFDEDDPAQDGKRPVWPWLLALLLLVLLAAGAWLLLRDRGEPVPDVTGQRLQAARDEIVDAGFKVGEVTRDFSEQRQGIVLSQTPEGGDRAEPGSEVDLVVSQGEEPVEVPDVTGQPRAQAVATLEAAGFRTQVREDFDEEVQEGRVIRTNPAAGARAEEGSVVTVVVSQGPEAQAVPEVVGLARGDAERILEEAGFGAVVADTVDGTVPAGDVVEQSPAGGTEAEPGTDVRLVVASGFNAVPEVIGASEEQATAALEEAGFAVNVVEQPGAPGAAEGEVADQDPAPGSRRELGSAVTITVSRGDEGADEGEQPDGG